MVSSTGVTGFSDLHNSALYRLFTSQDSAGLDHEGFAISKSSLKAAHTQFMVFSIGVPRFSMKTKAHVKIQEVVLFLRKYRRYVEANYPEWKYVGNHQDMQQARTTGKMAWTFALEDAWLMEGDIRWLDTLHEVGIRIIQPGHRFVNDFFEDPTIRIKPAFLGPSTHFSKRGIALLNRMKKLELIIDVSHLPPKAFWQVIEWNKGNGRLIASHANAFAVCEVARNLTDEQIKAIVATDGLIGICMHSPMLHQKTGKPAPTKAVVDHLQHLIKVAGPNHICLGTDWEGLIQPAKGLSEVSQIKNLNRVLQKQQIPPNVVESVLWENALRLFDPVPRKP